MTKPQSLIACVLLVSVLPATAIISGAQGRGSSQETRADNEQPKVLIKSKPEPHYPEEARKEKVEATIVLRAIFTSSGKVTNIKFVKVIPTDVSRDLVKDLKKRCIEAARQIKFEPATRDGHPVSMYVELEYNFSLE